MIRKRHYYLLLCVVTLLLTGSAASAGQAFSKPNATLSSPAQASVSPGILYPPLPTNMSLPTYDYAAPETYAGYQFTKGIDNFSRVLGVIWDDTTQTWELTGNGWLASAHSQSEYGSNNNTFCAKCHSPLQATAVSGFNNGLVTNASAIPQERFQAVTCGTCHPPDNVTAVLGATYPNAWDGGREAIYLWKGVNNPASYQPISTGQNSDGTSQEDALCLNCHEVRHNTDSDAFEAMYTGKYGLAVRCIDCHMAPYQGTNAGFPEFFHNWNVGADLPDSCGAEGSGRASCHESTSHTPLTVETAETLIPYIRSQHSEWWNLPPFNGNSQVAVSAHSKMTVAEYRVFSREIALADSDGKR